MTVTDTPTAHDERHVLRVVLAHAVDMFETPSVELGSTVGGFTPGIDQCIADLEGHPEEKGLRLEIALPPDEITADLAEKMTVTLRRFCSERAAYNSERAVGDDPQRPARVPRRAAGNDRRARHHRGRHQDRRHRRRVALPWSTSSAGCWRGSGSGTRSTRSSSTPSTICRENRALATLGRAEVTIVPLTDDDHIADT